VDPEEGRELLKASLQYYEKAQHHYSVIEFIYPSGGHMCPPTGYAQYYFWLGMLETDTKERRMLFQKSESAGMKAQEAAEKFDFPNAIHLAFHFLGLALTEQASLEPDSDKKRDLLKRALKSEESAARVRAQVFRYDYWDQALTQKCLATIKAGLADVELDFDSKGRLLEEAVASMEKMEKLADKIVPYFQRIGHSVMFTGLQLLQDKYATILEKLHKVTNNPEHLREAIEILHKAIESAEIVGMVSRVAESYWKIAKAQDILGEHMKAAINYERASGSYQKATEKIPQLRELYKDHALYMQAWSEIEKAKHNHATRQYGQAGEHYKSAANLHKSTDRWN
jgi:tetratricopeptide (TPR) repeat protein